MSANVTSMMSASGVTPWHKQGVVLPSKGVIDKVAFTASGQDWIVEKEPIYDKSGIEVTNNYLNVRQDNRAHLGIVGCDYEALQNWSMYEVGNSLVTEGKALYETAGCLAGGRKVWTLLRLPDDFDVVKGDKVESYITICNSHDGQTRLRIFPTAIRVVCQNTLNIAIKRASTMVAIKHTMGMQERLKTVHRVLGIVRDEWGELMTASKYLAGKQMNSQKVDDFLKEMLPALNTTAKVSNKTLAIKNKLMGFFEYGTGNAMPGVKGSAWAMFNGVVEYVDYQRPTRVFAGDKVEDQRAEALLFKSGQEMKQVAFDLLMKI